MIDPIVVGTWSIPSKVKEIPFLKLQKVDNFSERVECDYGFTQQRCVQCPDLLSFFSPLILLLTYEHHSIFGGVTII